MTRLCGRDDLASGEARRFDVDGCPVALVRVGDEFLAIGDTCSHAAFSLRTGEPESLPATRPVPVYAVTVDGDDVSVEIR